MNVARPFKILIAERNVLVAEAIEAMFVELNGGVQVFTALSLPEARTLALHEHPDLIVMDAWIEAGPGDKAVRQLLEWSPASAVYVTATNCDAAFEHRMVRAGAMGCCDKEAMPAQAGAIVDAIRKRG